MERKLHQNVYISIPIFLFCGFVMVINRGLDKNTAMMPYMLTAFLAALGIVILLDGLKQTAKARSEGQEIKPYLTWGGIKYPLMTFVLVACYAVLFWFAGYFVATPVMVVALMRFMKMTSWKTILLIVLCYIVFIYFFFVGQMHVSIDNWGWIGTYLQMR